MLLAVLGLILLVLVYIGRDIDVLRKDVAALRKLWTCPTCHGTGREEVSPGSEILGKCLSCKGTGLRS
jgi:hypothetical protein